MAGKRALPPLPYKGNKGEADRRGFAGAVKDTSPEFATARQAGAPCCRATCTRL